MKGTKDYFVKKMGSWREEGRFFEGNRVLKGKSSFCSPDKAIKKL